MANLFIEFKGNGIIKTWSKQYPFECFTVPRESVSTAIPDIKTKMGVYFLVNTYEGRKDADGNLIKRKVYIGKTSTGMSRFFNHKSKKEWWDKIYFFTANKQYFDEDTILGLENLLITKYKESGLYLMEQENSVLGGLLKQFLVMNPDLKDQPQLLQGFWNIVHQSRFRLLLH